MPVYKLTAYPKRVTLRDGSVVTLRPMEPGDAGGLLEMFRDVPAEDRWFLKEDVTSEKVVREWVEHLDYNRALPLLAVADGKIVADGVLVRRRGVARQHLAEVRIVVHPAWRNRGLGSTILKELCDIAAEADIEKVMSELVEDEKDAID
ncbi:MAG TPA: GNAT family N-acetyltransferase, partial [Dehalococcoidia bacterium]|nr:GNAT family N-acetyltransferase [Dehalococcoidia bacterium]